MEEINVMFKPDWISWDDIHELLMAAHKKNIEKGVVMNTTTMNGEQLKLHIGESGCCIVALCGNKLIGTTSVRVMVGNKWFDKDKKICKGALTGILPSYQGLGILEEMNELRDKFITENGVQVMEGDTPEKNTVVRRFVAKNGFKEVRFFPARNQNHFSVYFVKWLDGCPFSDKYIERKYELSKFITKIQYKPGKEERCKVLSIICDELRGILDL